MNLIDDFSILIWGEKPNEKVNKLVKDFKLTQDEQFYEAISVILCVNPKNYDRFCELKSFMKIYSLFSDVELNIHQLKALQIALLNTISKEDVEQITPFIMNLHEENIIKEESAQKVISLLKLVENKPVQKPKPSTKAVAPVKNSKDYKEHINFFENILKEFRHINESENLANQTKNLEEKIKNRTFSIGITGVMNAGKSTMLNALLGKEILGTSVVPETANLTLIKHSNNPYAKVNFWKKDEWERIESAGEFMPSIKKFIDVTKKSFGSDIEKYISETGISKEIKTSELSDYTSAKSPKLLCNLVKSVELYEDLEFVKDGVSIVDTPGLDDPVVQREEITKEYLSECDVMIHLMNVNQSATEKDVDFIIDSLTYGHISRLLIVITRIDTVSADELNEVINYTKNSIKNKLTQSNSESKFDSIISKIDFLPIAGKLALMHRTGKENEALELGYDLEKTGILEIEKYLQNVLFGKDSEKNILMLQSLYKETDLLFKNLENSLKLEQTSLSKSANELKKDYELIKAKNEQNRKNINQTKEKISNAKTSLEGYFTTLKHFADTKLEKIKNVTVQRLNDDASYEWRKNKKKPADERIKTMIETSMKDGIVDMVRDYRYEFQKRMQSEMEQIWSDGLFRESKNHFDAKKYFEENFGASFLSGSYAVTVERVLGALKKMKKGDIESFNTEISAILKDTKEELGKTILPSLNDVNKHLLEGFITLSNKPLNELEASINEEEKMLSSHIKLLEDGSEKAGARLEAIKEKLQSLSALQKSLKGSKI